MSIGKNIDDRSMNGCISTNLEVIPTDCTVVIVLCLLRLQVRGLDENGLCIEKWFGVSCALILTLNSVGLTQIIFEAHVMLG